MVHVLLVTVLSREERKFWIHSKYIRRKFVDPSADLETEPNPPPLGAVLPEGLEQLKTMLLDSMRTDATFRKSIVAMLAKEVLFFC
jgi:hypothetical protein